MKGNGITYHSVYTGSEWMKEAKEHQYWWDPGAKAACSDVLHFHNHLPGILCVLIQLGLRNKGSDQMLGQM